MKHVKFESQPDILSDTCLESDTVVAPDSMLQEVDNSIATRDMSENASLMTKEESSDKLIQEDVSLPSQFLLPNLDDSSSEDEAKITQLKSEADLPDIDREEEMPLVDS